MDLAKLRTALDPEGRIRGFQTWKATLFAAQQQGQDAQGLTAPDTTTFSFSLSDFISDWVLPRAGDLPAPWNTSAFLLAALVELNPQMKEFYVELPQRRLGPCPKTAQEYLQQDAREGVALSDLEDGKWATPAIVWNGRVAFPVIWRMDSETEDEVSRLSRPISPLSVVASELGVVRFVPEKFGSSRLLQVCRRESERADELLQATSELWRWYLRAVKKE